MKRLLIAGLGNPGKRYETTRHNIGFLVLDSLAERLGLSFRENIKPFKFLMAEGFLPNDKLLFVKPLEYMNRSGEPIRYILSYNEIFPEDLLVIHDDMDIEFGRIKLSRNGGHGGHNGIRSIIQNLQTKKFPRVKVGIGRPPAHIPPDRYVLSGFSAQELELLPRLITMATDAVISFIEKGLDTAMNEYNGMKIA